ncbi:MAG: DNA/RNA nuclease SfsA [Spirochaetaceae bacterium]|nr:DNA/RNA nuclease SfsA [Spirochaetaceae bacterium]MCF7949251.1 DNA/RNA nuclease SfsA [Spirochaetia bacterium]MCF7951638.1 DNA/RNA nuclease SfsA [Spirochaetaceae bacterium]
MEGGSLQIFSHPEPAWLMYRPNRFVMIVRDKDGVQLRAHCPNPGKLTEFLLPGQPLLIERHRKPERSTDCTAVAVEYKGKIIFLYSSKANDIAGSLVLPGLHPRQKIVPEWTVGRSRFDFLVRGASELLVEVKSCSLSEYGVAMFPDTATARGSRHVEELIELSTQGRAAEVLFILSHEDTQRFMPNAHTDPLFCRALHRARELMPVRAVSVATDRQGYVRVVDDNIPIDTETPDALAKANSGVYLLVIRLDVPTIMPLPRIGSPELQPGWYIYVGSAKTNLQQRIARHLRKRKKLHWHIDYLLQQSSSVKAFPIRTAADLECTLARDISKTAAAEVDGFGCSDCRCNSHLFFFPENPLHNRELLEVLFYYRHVGFMGVSRG